jgi:hypothetical protein
MAKELDRELNQTTGFVHCEINAQTQIRLLRLSPSSTSSGTQYTLQRVSLDALLDIEFRALSYSWGTAEVAAQLSQIKVDNQAIYIRLNLFNFLKTAGMKAEYGLFFIDAICINQLDDEEKQYQIRFMTQIYGRANEVIAWLGHPDPKYTDCLHALNDVKRRNYGDWTPAHWDGFGYLSCHPYWSRLWVVQEIVLASTVTVWCGFYTYEITLFGTRLDHSYYNISPAERIISHRHRQYFQQMPDPLGQGTVVETLGEMTRALTRPSMAVKTYHSRLPDLAYELVKKFGHLECSNPRDKLYALLGILPTRTAARITPDYSQGVEFSFSQTLMICIEEVAREFSGDHRYLDHILQSTGSNLYYTIRDVYGIADDVAMPILGRLLADHRFIDQLRRNGLPYYPEERNLHWDSSTSLLAGLQQLLNGFRPPETAGDGRLFQFHSQQRKLGMKMQVSTTRYTIPYWRLELIVDSRASWMRGSKRTYEPVVK